MSRELHRYHGVVEWLNGGMHSGMDDVDTNGGTAALRLLTDSGKRAKRSGEHANFDKRCSWYDRRIQRQWLKAGTFN